MTSSPGESYNPGAKVLNAFDIESHTILEILWGGRGIACRAGNVVLKRLDMSLEALEWLASAFGTIDMEQRRHSFEEPSIRLCIPLFGHLEDGSRSLVIDGWTAWNWLDGISSGSLGPLLEESHATAAAADVPYDPTLTYKWDHIIAAGERFSALMQKHQVTKPAFLEARKDPWGLADRIAWNELLLEKEMIVDVHIDNKIYPVPFGPHWRTEAKYLGESIDILHNLNQDVDSSHDEPFQIIHGDLTGNVLFCLPLTASAPPPGIIDMSPYFRPPSYSTAIVLVDALACENAPTEWAKTYLGNKRQIIMFARAVIFRIVSDYLLEVANVGAGDDYTRPVEVLREVGK